MEEEDTEPTTTTWETGRFEERSGKEVVGFAAVTTSNESAPAKARAKEKERG